MLFPGAFLIITTLAFNLLGDGLRDAFDVRGPTGEIAPCQPPNSVDAPQSTEGVTATPSAQQAREQGVRHVVTNRLRGGLRLGGGSRAAARPSPRPRASSSVGVGTGTYNNGTPAKAAAPTGSAGSSRSASPNNFDPTGEYLGNAWGITRT